ncbi:UNVERIFIED_CONTAM: DeSI-like protein [Sesamum angustifolium]|uniref:DeSI-like protein n=1 Tax=Sesamum angustifolium TaxID=2727405 RepID=A0AAW2MMY2_9LAMI
MSRSEFRSFMEHLSNKYHGDTYHLISKNCNHFTDEVCQRLTGKPIPGWVNRLARVDGSDSGVSSAAGESEVEDDHHLLLVPNSDVAFLKDKPVRLAKDVL